MSKGRSLASSDVASVSSVAFIALRSLRCSRIVYIYVYCLRITDNSALNAVLSRCNWLICGIFLICLVECWRCYVNKILVGGMLTLGRRFVADRRLHKQYLSLAQLSGSFPSFWWLCIHLHYVRVVCAFRAQVWLSCLEYRKTVCAKTTREEKRFKLQQLFVSILIRHIALNGAKQG